MTGQDHWEGDQDRDNDRWDHYEKKVDHSGTK